MSCDKCEEVARLGEMAFLRVDKASVGVVACESHFNKIREALEQFEEESGEGDE